MTHLKLFLFGPPRLERAGEPVSIPRRKALALLIYLTVSQQPHSRDALATLLWPDSDQQTGRANLRRTLYRLSQALDEPILDATPETISLDPQADLWLDVIIFQQHITDCLPANQPSTELSPACLTRLTEAARLYTADFLAGFTLPDCRDYDEWQFFQAESLRRSFAHVLDQLVETHQASADFEQAILYARRRLALDPLHEPAHRQLMQLYALSGQPAAALRQYQECARLLDEELGLSPEPETTELFEAIKTKRGPAVEKTPILAGPLPQHAPALTHNLPPQPTPFVGREAELAALDQLLANPDTRLITIVGAGGQGKTRLALAAAERQVKQTQVAAENGGLPPQFSDGIFFVPLASLETPDRLVPALAEALSFPLDSSSRPARSPKQQLLDYLRQKRMLLIFDNFEHLLAGLVIVIDILKTAPGVHILATSRERLHLHEEHLFPIQGLAYPHEETGPSSIAAVGAEKMGATHAALQLFLQSAHRIEPDFDLAPSDWSELTRLCRLVEGMPLAIELAASWLDMLPLADIAAEIQRSLDFLETDVRNIPQRHRSIRAVFDASWQRLTADEQTTFAQLSIFRGGFTRQAARAVTGASLRILGKLVHKSLLRYDRQQDRYLIHELLRQYGAEQLTAQEARVWDRYSAYYCTRLAQLEAELKGARQQEALAELVADGENALAAWQWAAGQGQVEQLAQAMNSLGLFHEWRARFRQGGTLFRMAVKSLHPLSASETDPMPRIVLSRAIIWQSNFARPLGHRRQAEALVQQSVELLNSEALDQQADQVRTVRAAVLVQQGHLALNIDNALARQHYEDSLALYRALGATWETAYLLDALSELHRAMSHYDRAIETAQDALAIQRALGDQRGIAHSLSHLSIAARHQGQIDAAVAFARDSYAAYETLGHRADTADGLHNLGMTLTYAGEFDQALTALEKSIALYDELANRLPVPMACARAAIVAMSLGRYELAQDYAERAVSLGRDINDQGAVGLALTFTGWLHLVAEEYHRALEQLQAGRSIFQDIGRQAEMGMTLALMGGAYRGLGDRLKAHYLLRQALQSAADHQNFLPLTAGLPLTALMLVEQAETLPEPEKQFYQRHALALYALGQQYPAIGQACEVDAIAGRYLRPLMAALPPEFIEATLAEGLSLDLWPALAELLEKLSGLGWNSLQEA